MVTSQKHHYTNKPTSQYSFIIAYVAILMAQEGIYTNVPPSRFCPSKTQSVPARLHLVQKSISFIYHRCLLLKTCQNLIFKEIGVKMYFEIMIVHYKAIL